MNKVTETEKELLHYLKLSKVDKDSMIVIMLSLRDKEEEQKELIDWINRNSWVGQEEILYHLFPYDWDDD